MSIEQKCYGLVHEKCALTYSNIGNAYEQMKNYDLAILFYDQTLHIRKEVGIYMHTVHVLYYGLFYYLKLTTVFILFDYICYYF